MRERAASFFGVARREAVADLVDEFRRRNGKAAAARLAEHHLRVRHISQAHGRNGQRMLRPHQRAKGLRQRPRRLLDALLARDDILFRQGQDIHDWYLASTDRA